MTYHRLLDPASAVGDHPEYLRLEAARELGANH
jgi:hypothetical protein